MNRPALAALLVAGKGLDAVSTAVVLRLADDVRETVPLALWLIARFGVEVGMVLLWVLAVAAVALVAEAGVALQRAFPEEVPEWYPDRLRTAVYLGGAAWFAAVGVRNFSLLA